MPRTELTQFIGKQTRWKGTVIRFGKRLSRGDEQRNTVLLENVREVETKIEIDHSWITGGRWAAGLIIGDIIYFDALVCPYRRGDFLARWDDAPIEIDYKLINPTTRGGRQTEETMDKVPDRKVLANVKARCATALNDNHSESLDDSILESPAANLAPI